MQWFSTVMVNISRKAVFDFIIVSFFCSLHILFSRFHTFLSMLRAIKMNAHNTKWKVKTKKMRENNGIETFKCDVMKTAIIRKRKNPCCKCHHIWKIKYMKDENVFELKWLQTYSQNYWNMDTFDAILRQILRIRIYFRSLSTTTPPSPSYQIRSAYPRHRFCSQ